MWATFTPMGLMPTEFFVWCYNSDFCHFLRMQLLSPEIVSALFMASFFSQGMNMLVALGLIVLDDEEEVFW